MGTIPEILQPPILKPEPVSWKEAFLAGTPALLFPVVFLLPTLVYWLLPSSQSVFNFISVLIVFGLLAAGVIWAWKSGWPRWSGGWVAWGWVLLLVSPGLILQSLSQPLSQFYLSVVLFTALALLLYRSMRKDPIKGILAAFVLMNLFWLPHLEFVPEIRKGIVLLVTWLIIALVSMLIMKLGRVNMAVGLALLATFLVAFPYTYAANYLRIFPPDAPADVITHQANFADITGYFAPTLVGCFTLLLGPLLASELWKLSRGSGKAGRNGFRLAFTGLFLNLVGNLTATWLYYGTGLARLVPGQNPPGLQWIVDSLYTLNRLAPAFMAGLAYLGIVLYLIGSIQVVSASRQTQMTPGILVSVLIVLIPILLPMLAMYPSWFGMVSTPPLVPFGFLHLERLRYPAYLTGLIILAVAGWLAAQLGQKEIGIS